MSRMSELHGFIMDRLLGGSTFESIVSDVMAEYNLPQKESEDFVYDVEYQMEMEESNQYHDDMDGDHQSALASAGWGTDEDYGHYGDDY
jgi:hypothetical protein